MYNTACLTHHDQSMLNLVCSHYLKFRNFQENASKVIHFITVLLLFARQWHTFHYENELLSLTCSHYHMSRKLPGKLHETILPQPFFPSNKGRYACHIRRSFPKGESSYHTRPRPAYQELLRASARVEGTLSHLEERAQRATIEHATLARANLRRPARPPGFCSVGRSFNF